MTQNEKGCGCKMVNKSGHGMTKQEKFMRHVNKTDSCWLWTGSLNERGYGRIIRKKKNVTAHRYSYELFIGLIPKGLFVCHKCDIRPCVNPDHLFIGTNKDNMKDAYDKGTKMGFQVKPIRKLNWDQVIEIRKAYSPHKMTRPMLAKQFDVSRATIDSIVDRKWWKEELVRQVKGDTK